MKRKAVRYRWSSADGKKIKYDAKYNKPISPQEEQEFIDAHSLSGGSTSVLSQEDDQLPF
jgi:hypothetical protein